MRLLILKQQQIDLNLETIPGFRNILLRPPEKNSLDFSIGGCKAQKFYFYFILYDHPLNDHRLLARFINEPYANPMAQELQDLTGITVLDNYNLPNQDLFDQNKVTVNADLLWL